MIGFVISFRFFWKMSMESSTYIGFANGASLHTQHSASAASVIYNPMGQMLAVEPNLPDPEILFSCDCNLGVLYTCSPCLGVRGNAPKKGVWG